MAIASLPLGAYAAFEKAVNEGRCFSIANQSGVASQAGLSATTPVLTLANPAGNNVDGILWFAGVTSIVAPAAAATVFLAAGTNTVAAAVTGTETTAHRNLKLGGKAPGIVPLLSATLPAAPVAIDILGAFLTGAITVVTQVEALGKWYPGSIILAPGTNISLQTSTASGASGLLCSYIWEERERAG